MSINFIEYKYNSEKNVCHCLSEILELRIYVLGFASMNKIYVFILLNNRVYTYKDFFY